MWNTSVRIEYIAGLIADSLENYSVNDVSNQFDKAISELKKYFVHCSNEEIADIPRII